MGTDSSGAQSQHPTESPHFSTHGCYPLTPCRDPRVAPLALFFPWDGMGPLQACEVTTLGGGCCRGVSVPSFQSLPRLLGLPRSDSRNQGPHRPRLGCLPGSEALPSGLALQTSGQIGGRRVMRTHPYLFPQPGARAEAPRCRRTACRKCYTEGCTSPISGVCQRFPPGGQPRRPQMGQRLRCEISYKSDTGACPPPTSSQASPPRTTDAQPMLPPSLSTTPLPDPPRPGSPTKSGAPALPQHTHGPPGLPPLPDGCRVLVILRSLVTCRDPGRGAGTGGSRCGWSSGPSGEEGTLAGTPGASPRCSSGANLLGWRRAVTLTGAGGAGCSRPASLPTPRAQPHLSRVPSAYR